MLKVSYYTSLLGFLTLWQHNIPLPKQPNNHMVRLITLYSLNCVVSKQIVFGK